MCISKCNEPADETDYNTSNSSDKYCLLQESPH